MQFHIMNDTDDDDDETAKAFAAISAQLQQFTSSKLGSLIQSPKKVDNQPMMMEDDEEEPSAMDAMGWMQQTLRPKQQQQSPVTTTPLRTTPTNRRSKPLLERADTPVMSNSSSKLSLSSTNKKPTSMKKKLDGGDNDDGDEDVTMEPVQTPYKAALTLSFRPTSPPPLLMTSSSWQDPKRYHDALWNFLQARRSLSTRIELEQEEMALEGAAPADPSSSLALEESRMEMQFLKTLHQLAWDSSSSFTPAKSSRPLQAEGDVWLLLSMLRPLGFSALVWDDDLTSARQYSSAQTVFLQQLAAKIAAPQDLLQELASPAAPLSLQRRHRLVQWIQTCLDQVRVEPKPRTEIPSTNHPDAAFLEPTVTSETATSNFLQASLSYVLAGRLDDAKELARSQGQPWRAAAWGGGEAAGAVSVPNTKTQTMDTRLTGNPHRFLWKRQAWMNGRRLLNQSPDEAAIYSLLSNDVSTCLANPSLRSSWSRSLYAVLYSMWGRLEDELLYMHNTQLRRNHPSPPYPGTAHLRQEEQQMLATSSLANVTESQALQLLVASPFCPSSNPFQRAMASILIGKSALLEFCQVETTAQTFQEHDGNIDQDENGITNLRFLTHFTLYLDSLQASTTPIDLGLTPQKNQVLFQYIRYLESRPSLWSLMTLYVSLLPEDKIMSYYPSVLAKVLEESERTKILEQIRELLPHLEMNILRQVVRLCLLSTEIAPTSAATVGHTTTTMTLLDEGGLVYLDDETRCRSLQWLLQFEEHMGDALICSNILLRRFFLDEEDDKIEISIVFVEEHLPEDFLHQVDTQTSPGLDMEDSADYMAKVQNARTEHLAFLSYLDAYRNFGKWKNALSSTASSSGANGNPDGLNMDWSSLNPTEASIAKRRVTGDWVRQKKAAVQDVLEVAEEARSSLYNVLTHPGGWLSTADEDVINPGNEDDDKEQKRRRQDLAEIRARYLVLAVNLYHEVCEGTAFWLSRCLDGIPSNLTRQEALGLLADAVALGGDEEDVNNTMIAPSYWFQQGLDLAILVADDRHGIHQAFGRVELQEFLSKLAETAVSQLMN